MGATVSRRAVLATAPAAGLAVLGLRVPVAFGGAREPQAPWPGFPQQDPALVRDIVGAAHSREERVRELVSMHPALVNAWWDWGFGDWESPLGAAAHTGRRSIAEFLIEHGARVDIFAATMLGWLDVVKSMVGASPGVQGTLGPHCITLLSHAKAGGERAAEVAKYLEGLADADSGPKIEALAADRAGDYVGTYAYGPGPADRFDISLVRQQLQFVTADQASRRIHHLGGHAFFPAGVPSVQLRFEMADGRAKSVVIHDHGPRLSATRS